MKFITDIIKGMVIGVANIIPGVSGGTMMVSMGIYPKLISAVNNLFKEFKYNPIDDARFAILEGSEEALTDNERVIINLVLNTFGMYGGKALERITHKEEPWLAARKGYDDGIPSQEIIPKESIQRYFKAVDKKYCIRTEKGLKNYINDMIQ